MMTDEVTTEVEQDIDTTQESDQSIETQEDEVQAATTEESEEESSSEDSATEENEGETEKKKVGGFQKRVKKLTKKAAEAEREAEYWKKVALENKGSKNDSTQDVPQGTEANSKPNADDFENHDEYVEALTDWKLDQKLQERDFKNQQRTQQEAKQKELKNWENKVESFMSDHPDFVEVLEEAQEEHDVDFDPIVQEAIFQSDLGPQVMYHMAKNPEILEKISSLSPFAAIKELGKIESKLEASATSQKTNSRKTTKAPPPNKTIRGTAKVTVDPNKMTFKEYEAYRNKTA